MSLSLENAAKIVLVDNYQGFASMGHGRLYASSKRLFDLVGGTLGLLVLLPTIIVVKAAALMTGDFHSIFYTQERIGKDGQIFKLYKFRSMRPNADEELKKILRKNPEMAKEYRKMKKLENDPRITKIGAVLRQTSIDELPQIINIIKGDMSIIGCRPYLPREKKDMRENYHEIVSMRPGLTGFWQVSLRSRGTFKERVAMETYYVRNCDAAFDWDILKQTIKSVIKKTGAL